MKKNVVALFLSLLLVFAAAGGVQAYTDLLAFGDSLSDNGTKDDNGIEGDKYGNGVYTNGKVWVEYMAEDLGVSLFDMAYGGAVSGKNVPYAWSEVYKGAYAYYVATCEANDIDVDPDVAHAIATAEANESGYDSNYGLQWQVDTFLKDQLGDSDISSGTLITMTAGGNDFFNLATNLNNDPYSPQSAEDYADGLYSPNYVASNVASAVGKLIAAGGKNFLLQNIAMPGNEWATGFNYYLDLYLAALCADNSGVNITILDMTVFMPDGFDYEGTWIDDHEENPDTLYAFWDQVGVHPSTEMHREIADYALSQVNPVPEPASIMLLMTGLIGFVGAKRRKK